MVTFTIEVRPEKIDRIKSVLEAEGVIFDPERQVIAFNDAALDQAVAMGHHLPGMLEGVNQHLDEEGLTPRVPTNHQEWSIERRHAFLEFAIVNFRWDDETVGDGWWKDEGTTWEELAAQHPRVFQAKE